MFVDGGRGRKDASDAVAGEYEDSDLPLLAYITSAEGAIDAIHYENVCV